MILFSLLLANTVWIACLLALTLAFYMLLKRVERCQIPESDLPFVSIIVPARNEEAKIARCLESLLSQDYPGFEVIVIDDRSSDRTPEIIESFAKRDRRLKFVRGKDAPQGWVGKCNALAYAVGFASGDWFIFTDADTCHSAYSVRDAIAHAVRNKVDLISFVPMQELGSFWEKLVMSVLLSSFLIGDPFHTVNDPKARRAYAYGQYIICRRRSYLALGGHQAVRDEIVEDHALGRVFKEKGYKIAVADGKTLYSVRMYTNLESMWQGWTKNLYSLIDSRLSNLIMIVLCLLVSAFLPLINLGIVVGLWLSQPDYFTPLLTVVVVAQWAFLAVWFWLTGEHRQGAGWPYFFLIPAGAIAVTALHLHAAYLVLSGSQVSWKGRRYTVNTSKTIQPKTTVPLEQTIEPSLAPDPTE
ncbi:MAG TPA: glycosyltransferase [Candidatus Obscuribacterales bacterium]